MVCRVKDEVGRRWISRAWRRGSLKLRSDVIRLSLCNMILLWNREWIMRGETGSREAITRLL